MDEFHRVLDQVRNARDPEAALVVTQNNEADIVGAEIIGAKDPYFILLHGLNASASQKKAAPRALWWAPPTKSNESQSW